MGIQELGRKIMEVGQRKRVTSEAVVWAYRLFLGRDPENSSIVNETAKHTIDMDTLRRNFMQSDEFQRHHRKLCRPSMTGLEEPIVVEDQVSDADLQKIFDHIQATWQYLGNKEPHWSVLTAPEYLQKNLDHNMDRFYATGKDSANQFLASMERNHVDKSRFKTCLEYGCGVGRVTYWLAQSFAEVHGYDISAAHLAEADAFLKKKATTNVQLHHVQKVQDLNTLPKVDAIYTLIVLQHNPPPIMRFILGRFMEVLNPGGVAYFQIPTFRRGYRYLSKDYLANNTSQHVEMEMHILPQKTIFELAEQHGCRVLEVMEDGWAGFSHGEVSNTFLIQKRDA